MGTVLKLKTKETNLSKSSVFVNEEKTMDDFCRMDYVSRKIQYIGTKDEAMDASEIITLPIEGVANGTTFFCVDTKNVLIFYKNQWYDIT